jgi:hypothetical protein
MYVDLHQSLHQHETWSFLNNLLHQSNVISLDYDVGSQIST